MIRKDFIITVILVLGILVILSNMLNIPQVLASSNKGSAWAVTIYKSLFGVVTIKTKTGIDIDYSNVITHAEPWTAWSTCCGWYHVSDHEVSYVQQTYRAEHGHEYTFEHKLCILGICAPPDQTVSYENYIEVELENGQCQASAGGQYSYYEASGGCR